MGSYLKLLRMIVPCLSQTQRRDLKQLSLRSSKPATRTNSWLNKQIKKTRKTLKKKAMNKRNWEKICLTRMMMKSRIKSNLMTKT